MSITLPLTRDLDGLQVGAAARIADIAKHFPEPIKGYVDEANLRNHARDAVLWAKQIVIEAEKVASEIPVDGHGVGPDLGDE